MEATSTILAQVAPAATVETQLYVVPAAGTALIQEIAFCNRSAASATFRLSISLRGAATANAHYLYYDLEIPGNETFACELGVTLSPYDVIRGYFSAATVSVTVFGVQT